MSALSDNEITGLLTAHPTLCADINAGDARINRASLDLTIGNIYQPETTSDNLGSAMRPCRWLSLDQGQTAIIETAERINLPSNIIAVGFPPARVTTNGLLTSIG